MLEKKKTNLDGKQSLNVAQKGKEKISAATRGSIKSSTMNLTIIAMLTALLVVLSLFCTIKTDALKITLDFIPVMIAAKLYGIRGAGLVAGLGDIIGYICHPTGPWFPPITVTAIITGIVFGILLKDNSLQTVREKLSAVISVVISQLLISAFVTPLWLNILYKTSYMTFFITRLPQIAVMTAIQLIFIPIMIKSIDSIGIVKMLRNVKTGSIRMSEKNQNIKEDN